MVSKIPFLVFPLLWMMSIINVNVCLESNSTFQIILVDSLFTLSWGMADLLFVWQPLPFTTCRREVEWIYIINIFGLTTLSVQRVCIYFYFSWVISVSVFGQVNNFAVVVGPNSSVWVSGIRGASSSTVTSLNPLFRVETLAAESLVVVFISNIDVSGIYIPPFFLWGYPSACPCYHVTAMLCGCLYFCYKIIFYFSSTQMSRAHYRFCV